MAGVEAWLVRHRAALYHRAVLPAWVVRSASGALPQTLYNRDGGEAEPDGSPEACVLYFYRGPRLERAVRGFCLPDGRLLPLSCQQLTDTRFGYDAAGQLLWRTAVHVEPRRRGNPYLLQTKDDYDELGAAELRHYYRYTAGRLHSSTTVSRSAAGETTTVQCYYDEAGLPKEQLVSPYRAWTGDEDQLLPAKRFRYVHERL